MQDKLKALAGSMLAALMLMTGTLFTSPAVAAEVSIGMASDASSMDPHFFNVVGNTNVSQNVFDCLVNTGKDLGKLEPALAESWRMVDDLTWEFKLRRGVKFHDGGEFTAEDVAWSLDRPGTIVNSPGPFTLYTKAIVSKLIVDKYTIRLKTATPYATLLPDLSNIFIVSKRATKGLTTEDFNAGKGMVGTGPYKFVQWKRGDRVELARNDSYWGVKPAWDKVTLRMLTTPAARVAALLAGDVQMIENVPSSDRAGLKRNPDVRLSTVVGNRVIFLETDQRDKSPFVTSKDGKPLDKNPLKDIRVRQAISKAINRVAIVDKVMEGNASATGQFMPAGFYGSIPGWKVPDYDVAGAKKLLAEAGYPDGFGLTLHGPNDRYVNDAKVLQTVAQMLSRVGINAKVETLPAAVFFGRMAKQDFSVMMFGWGGGAGHISTYLKSMMTTYDPDRGMGTGNYGRYSDPKLDSLVDQAYVTMDPVKGEKLWQQASEIGLNDVGIIPLHHQMNVWATRKGYLYQARSDERTLATELMPAK
jgi:peptide/nickel transport system substrate-binding protein